MSGRDFRNIAEIMKQDFKDSFKNPIVTIILIAIIILPSLYALLNIQACWDPYENTDELTFAIANLDKGTKLNGTELNVGNELVKDLKNNDKFDWTFVTEDELRKGVHEGDYYAGIIVPKNLSKNVVSIMGDNPKQAELEYIVNVKENPVAAKLTESGANTVYTTLNAKIVQFINLAAYGKLGELEEGLSSGASQLASGGSQLSAGAGQISSGASQVHDGADKVSTSSDKVQDGADKVKQGSAKVQDGADKVQKGSSDINKGADKVKQGSSDVSQAASQVEEGADAIQSQVDPSTLPDPMKQYVEANVKLANASGQVAQGSSKLAQGSAKLAESSSKLANGAGDVAGGAGKVANGAGDVAGGAGKLANGSVELAKGSLSLAAGAELLSSSAAQALYSASGALSSSANSLSGITGINESQLGDYFYSPIKLNKNELFPVPNYGSNVSPFYIVLSMWVGAIITCVMVSPGTSEGTKYTPFEMYFGKLLFFIIMSILQAGVTLVGCYLLGVYVANWPLFIFSAVLVSAVFMILVYSLISALGNLGRGLSVILLVLQISSTGGIYPVEIMHKFFQTLYPYMPMTYGIRLIRESQLGLVWSNYLPALTLLIVLGILTVIAAIIIKKRADKASHYFEERLQESGLFKN